MENMEYNSNKKDLIIPEYGRNVQALIMHAKTIKDDEYRQAFAAKIVNLIQQMHPQSRNVEDYKAKLWHHVMRISDYELEVTPPMVIPTAEEAALRPERVPYPDAYANFRHYGSNVHNLVAKAIAMEDEEKREEFAIIIGAYMKLAYRSWNRENVSDEQIKIDLERLSKGELTIPEDAPLDNLVAPNKKRPRRSVTTSSRSNDRRSSSNNYRSNSGRNNDRRNSGRSNDRRNSGGRNTNFRKKR